MCPAAIVALCMGLSFDPQRLDWPAVWELLPRPIGYKDPNVFGGFHPDNPEEEAARRRGEGSNGLVVDLSARVGRVWGKDAVLATWTMRYVGPRPPLAIWRPTLNESVSTERVALSFGMISSLRPDRHIYYTIQTPLLMPIFRPARVRWEEVADDFVRVPAGGMVTGTLVVQTDWLRDDLCRMLTDDFTPARPPKKIRLNMRIKEWHRGTQFNLDAWTGDVETNEVEIDLPTW